MAKMIDITEKLTFDGNPKLVIREKEIEVNADAPTMLKVMALMGSENPGVNEIVEAYNLLFPDKSKKEIEKLKIGFQDFIVLVQEAVQLVVGDNTESGEH